MKRLRELKSRRPRLTAALDGGNLRVALVLLLGCVSGAACGFLELQQVHLGVSHGQGSAYRLDGVSNPKAESDISTLHLNTVWGVPKPDIADEIRAAERAARDEAHRRDLERKHEEGLHGSDGTDVTIHTGGTPEPTPSEGDGLLDVIPEAPTTVEEGKAYVLWGLMLLLAAFAYRIFRYGIPGRQQPLEVPKTRSDQDHQDTD